MHFNSDISSINNRALVILSTLGVIWYTLLLVYVGVGIRSGQFYAQTILPIKENLNAIIEGMDQETKEDKQLQVPAGNDASINIEINSTVKVSTPEAEVEQIQKTEYYVPPAQPTVVYYTYPTVEPGKPGSKEWEDQFWKEWNERGAYIDQKNAEVQEAQKKFCEENPDLCN